jgi:hypothetical protein
MLRGKGGLWNPQDSLLVPRLAKRATGTGTRPVNAVGGHLGARAASLWPRAACEDGSTVVHSQALLAHGWC